MQMKSYLIETFQYNDHANKLALAKMGELADKIKRLTRFLQSMQRYS